MATYIGYFGPNESFRQVMGERAREGKPEFPEEFTKKVVELRDKLPSTIKLIGVYAPIASANSAPEHPAVWIAETDDPAELTFVNNHYAGYLSFQWVPVSVLGTTSQATQASLDASAAR